MNLKKILFLLGAASAVLVSCEKNDLQEGSNSQAVNPQDFFYVSFPKIIEDSTSSELRSGVDRRYLWQPGKKIKVNFNVAENRNFGTVLLAKSCFLEWMQYANLDFEFVESGEDILVEIHEQTGSSCSGSTYMGTTCLRINKLGHPSMNLYIGNASEENKRGVILHEIGHVLGFLH